MRIQRQGKLVEDTIPEDQALVLDTPRGLVIVAGCGHAGIINTMEYARKITATDTVFAVIGGFHLMSLSDDDLDRTEDAGVRRDPHPRGALRRAQRRAWIA